MAGHGEQAVLILQVNATCLQNQEPPTTDDEFARRIVAEFAFQEFVRLANEARLRVFSTDYQSKRELTQFNWRSILGKVDPIDGFLRRRFFDPLALVFVVKMHLTRFAAFD